jgi:hypothetical protein
MARPARHLDAVDKPSALSLRARAPEPLPVLPTIPIRKRDSVAFFAPIGFLRRNFPSGITVA